MERILSMIFGIKYPRKLKQMLKKGERNPEQLWAEVAEELHWFKPWQKVFEWKYPFFKWFAGGETNLCYNCLDRNIEKGRGNKPALIWHSSETNEARIYTYDHLLYEVKRFAASLQKLGIGQGDRITIYMPAVPEAVIAMLAIVRIGALHSVVFAGFGADALAERIRDTQSKILLTTDVSYRRGKAINLKQIVDEALSQTDSIEKVVILRRSSQNLPMIPGRDIFWEEALASGQEEETEALSLPADEPLFILYTSGTTAKPKGVVHHLGGYMTHIYAMGKWVYDLKQSDIWWVTSDVGWIVGHSCMVYAPLLFGCTTILYEGTPDFPTPDVWWMIIEKYKVTKFWTSPTGVRSLMKYGTELPKKYDLNSLKMVFCAGEVLNPEALEWLHKKVLRKRIKVLDHMWQTESSGPMVGYPIGIASIPIKPGSAGIPLPGILGDIVDEKGKSLPPNTKGIFICKKPFPGLTPTLWQDKERYVKTYWEKIPGFYYAGDAAYKDKDGYIWFMGRDDEVIKIAGHRIGTIEIENVLIEHPAVAESAVVGKPESLRGEIAEVFVVLKPECQPSEDLKNTLKTKIRQSLGAIVVIGNIHFVSMIPKTRSGKIMRKLIKAIVAGQPLGDFSTIEDATAIDEIKAVLKKFTDELKKS